MTITWKRGNLFEDGANAFVIPVNCVGAMGKGLALECKKRHSWVYKKYRAVCHDGMLCPGDVIRFAGTVRDFYLLATKDHWRDGSRLEWITQGLNDLNFKIHQHLIQSIALPALGCGNGGLAWRDVKPEIERYMSIAGVDVRCYEPTEAT